MTPRKRATQKITTYKEKFNETTLTHYEIFNKISRSDVYRRVMSQIINPFFTIWRSKCESCES